jgi:hypothetical protein
MKLYDCDIARNENTEVAHCKIDIVNSFNEDVAQLSTKAGDTPAHYT